MPVENDKNCPEPEKQVPSEVEVWELCLADISSVHSAILELERALSLPPLSFPSQELLGAGILQSALKAFPVRLVQSGEKFICVGGIRFYKLAKYCMASSEKIPVVISKVCKREVVQKNYLAEVYALPVLFAVSLDDARRLHEILENNKDNKLFMNLLPLRTKTAFADAFRISPATLRKKNHET